MKVSELIKILEGVEDKENTVVTISVPVTDIAGEIIYNETVEIGSAGPSSIRKEDGTRIEAIHISEH